MISHNPEERLLIKQEKLNSGPASTSTNYPLVQNEKKNSKFGQLFAASFGSITENKRPRKD